MATKPDRPDSTEDAQAFAYDIVDMALAASRTHPHAVRVGAARPEDPMFAEAVHFFTLLHAERPSAPAAAAEVDTAPWIGRYAALFDDERAWLARQAVTVAAPRRADLSRHELLVRGQREAMLTLARSDRGGCALGAIAALACDWPSVRAALSRDAEREADRSILDVLAAAAVTPAARRAIGFGAVQMLAVHRTLWDLLEARQAASLP